ncbi:hypothetical protein MVEN_00409500 [Mycena venus]|uniref:Uncharacterized protein n=1 Tax=Mycena venus TaxID=2733690 RepID=A0A8H6YUA4_9AGAR|nr:hypothetical protein MVEN_00409500 [Mycena venus]
MVAPSSTKVPVSSGSSFTAQKLTPEFLRLEQSIRALSTAVNIIQGQCQSPASDSHELAVTDKERARVFSHLATLLTTGSPLGRQTIAVTGGSSPRGFYINATDVVVKNESDPRDNEPAVVKLNAILPSRKTLKQLAEDRRRVTLIEHAADLFQALRLASQNLYNGDQRLLECFIVRRCHQEITRRLTSAVELLDPPLHDVLTKWELQCGDEIHEEWLMNPFPLILIRSSFIPHRRAIRWPNQVELLFSRDTFTPWKNFFVSLIKVVVSTVTNLRPERRGSSAMDAVLSLHFLRLFLSFGPARTILNLPSLKSKLEILLPRHHGVRDKCVTQVILQRWTAVVAYDAAASSLTARHCTVASILRQSLPKVHLIDVSVTSTESNKSMDSIPRIIRSKVMPAINLSKDHMRMVETLIAQHLSVAEFSGAVHCEAHIMGIAYAFCRGGERRDAQAFLDAFEGHSNTIGVAEQSCQICYWLSEELSLPNGEGYFNLQGSHGRTVPWTPPRFGIPLSVLGKLEVELLELLKDSTYRWLEEQLKRIPSSTKTAGIPNGRSCTP